MSNFHSFSDLEISEVSGQSILAQETPRIFDRDECFLRYARSMPARVHIDYHQWEESLWTDDWVELNGVLSPREAHFWFVAGTLVERLQDTSSGFSTPSVLRRVRYNGNLDGEQAVEMLQNWYAAFLGQYRSNHFYTQTYLAKCLGILLGTAGAVEALFDGLPSQWVSALVPYVGGTPSSEEDRQKLIALIDERLGGCDIEDVTDRALLARLAPVARHQKECRRYLDFEISLNLPPQDAALPVLFALENDDEFLAYFDKLGMSLDRRSIALLIARFGEDASEIVFERVTNASSGLGDLPEILSLIESPRIVPSLLHLYLEPTTSLEAESRLLEDNDAILVGLIEALEHRRFKSAAVELLRKHQEAGHDESIEAARSRTSPEQQKAVQLLVLEHVQIELPLLPAEAFPAWLTTIATPRKPKGLPKFVSQKSVKPIFTRDLKHALPKSAIYGILDNLKTFDGQEAEFVEGLRELADPVSLCEFLWALFSDWTRHGLQSQHAWCMEALAVCHEEELMERLAHYIEEWPAQRHHALAYRGLEILGAIGTDHAAGLLREFSETSEFKGVRARAKQLLG